MCRLSVASSVIGFTQQPHTPCCNDSFIYTPSPYFHSDFRSEDETRTKVGIKIRTGYDAKIGS